MKTAYDTDNTRSSIVVVLSLALAAALIAALIGLSDKPDVDVIGLAAGPATDEMLAAEAASADNFGFDTDDEATDEAAGDLAADVGDDDPDEPGVGAQAIVVPTAEPTATAEVAAAVEPAATDDPADATDESDQSSDTASLSTGVASAPGMPTTAGSVQGTFFTRPDEDEGAIVAQNRITVSFAEDGSGAFQGVLDITYDDGTHILLNMSGPLQWTPTTPQVKATLTGAYTYDAPIDADDVTSDDAELSITSLESGSGSLCTPKCFGFTFPPQNGL